MFDFNDNIIFQEKKFPHIFFSITVSITLILFYQLLSYYLFLSFGNAIGKNSEAYIVGAGQIFFMILPLLLIMKLSPLSPKTLFRLESKPGINFYIIAILGFVSLY
ncbi:MAG: hypothetical protein QG635_1796, partial [Bacteroidota bacterium]|nr:hypothetical protein [Bacteroidota bacterium]